MNPLKRNTKDFDLSSLEHIDQPVHIVLSGGGGKGVAHIAFLEKLELLGIRVHSISAASAGTLVGGMYASGMSTQDILRFFLETPLFRYSWLNASTPGVFKAENYREVIQDFIKPSFEDLSIPMYVATTNLEENTSYYFHSGDLITPILASCAVPAMFNPITIDGQLHSDGGVMDNFPVYPFLGSELPILGSYLGRLATKNKDELNSILKISNHSAQLRIHSGENYKFEQTLYTAIYPLDAYRSFDTKLGRPIYETACQFLGLEKRNEE